MLLVVLLGVFLVLSTACSGGDEPVAEAQVQSFPNRSATANAGNEEEVWAALLAKPLHFPALLPDGTCPATVSSGLLGQFEVAGAGPIRTSSGRGTMQLPVGPQFAGPDGWFAVKTLWISSGYDGPALIRGARLDAPGEVRFSYNVVEHDGRFAGRQVIDGSELRFPAGDTGVSGGGYGPDARYFPSHTHVEAPGCYAWQIDGPDFTDVIVFEAVSTQP